MGKSSQKKKAGNQSPEKKTAVGGKPKTAGKLFLHVILIAATGILVYSNTLNSPFQLDDNYLIGDNPAVKNLDYFLHPSMAKGTPFYDALQGRYFGYLTFALDYKLHGLEVKGFHIFNIAVHILNGLLVYLLVLLTFRTPFLKGSRLHEHSTLISLFTALFFTSHPVQTEAVTYVFQRLASLMATFYLLSLICYIKYRQLSATGQQSSRAAGETGCRNTALLRYCSAALYLFSVFFAVLAMKTKENAFTLPILITLYEFSFFTGPVKQRIVRLMPILLTLIIIPLSLAGTDRPAAEIARSITSIPRGDDTILRQDYLFTQSSVIVTYIRLLFFPINQNFDHDYPVFNTLFAAPVILSSLFLVSILCFGIYLFYKSRIHDRAWRLAAFGIFWFFIALSVESSIVPIPMIICEYRVYLPSVGALMTVMTGIFLLLQNSNSKYFRATIAALAVITVIFSAAAYARNGVWESRIRLWTDVVAKSPQKERGHTNLANAYKAEGLLDEAIRHFEIALKLKPDAKAYYNLGVVYWNKGLTNKAMEYYQNALKLNPNYAEAHNNLGAAFKSMGQTEKALEHYLIAIRLKPDYSEAHNNLGDIYSSRGMIDQALAQYQESLKLNPNFAEVYNNIGTVYKAKGLVDKAVEYYGTALRINPGLLEAHYNLGYIYFERKQMDDVRREFEAVLQIKPDMKYARKLIDFISASEANAKKR